MGGIVKHWAAVVVCFCFAVGTRAEEGPPKASQLNTTDAELKLLRRQVDQQRQKIDRLEAEVAAMRAHLRALGFEARGSSAPTSKPAPTSGVPGPSNDARPRRVVFILATDSREAVTEVVRAVEDMTSDQWFNVVFPRSGEATAYDAALVQATDFNKRKLAEFFKRPYRYAGNPLVAIEAAMQWRPKLIWFLAPGWIGKPGDEDAFLRDVHRVNLADKARINTVLFSSVSAEWAHLLWRISAETGGLCLNARGEPIDEPVLPFKPVPKPSPPPKPSILRDPSGG